MLLFLEVGFKKAETGEYTGPRLAWYSNEHSIQNSPDKIEGALDLLDIQNVEKPTPLELHQEFPFCLAGNSVIIRLPDKERFVFEARSEEESKRFVYGIRWVVARLAFNLIIGNPIIACELLEVGSGQEDTAMNSVAVEMVEKTLFSSQLAKLD